MQSKGDQFNSTLVAAVYQIQKSLAKFAIKYGLSATAMAELVRRAYVDAAKELTLDEGEKVLTTKICAMTGLYRKEVIRLQNLPPLSDDSQNDKYNRSVRVVTGWIRDKDFQTADGTPSALEIQGPHSFSELVKRYSGDMSPIAMQGELVRLGVVALSSENTMELVTNGYVASTDIEGTQILGTDTADLIDTITHNLSCDNGDRRFQRKVSYVSIPSEHAESFRQFAADESQRLLEKLDVWLAKHDADESSDREHVSRLAVGIYHIEKPHSKDEPSLGGGDE